MNQQYSHIAAFMWAINLGAEVVLPPAKYRDSFGELRSWTEAPLSTLLDVSSITSYWATRGLTLWQARCLPLSTWLQLFASQCITSLSPTYLSPRFTNAVCRRKRLT